ncbi:Bug family tripartite tricarboxylate transporter substrate binding protein [Roseomonas gilardii]|uniref:Bug family tripartite tricarboxylate transporter substrate binding protein n=1 Tax=Roseomonas gilardii TaxID=257708 RepID=UPI0004B23CF8|nr:tripartite tricarboxylate transporter substrate binding protein [Roseomonas gilardii]
MTSNMKPLLLSRRSAFAGALTLPALALSRSATAQGDFPSKPVRFLVPFPPGQASDTFTRLLAEALGQRWPRRCVVENRPGGAGSIGAEAAARSAPDGYTIAVTTTATHGINPAIMGNLPYDAERDFAYISTTVTLPLVLVANPSFPHQKVGDLLAAARSAPGEIVYGSAGPGTGQHMAGELFAQRGGVRMTHVPYRGSGPAMSDLIAGTLPVMFDSIVSALPHIQSGRVRAIAVATLSRQESLPDVPTIAEVIPGFEVFSWAGCAVPAATPRELVTRISTDVMAVLRDPGMVTRMTALGGIPAPQTPEECTAFVHAEISRWRDLARAANIAMNG